MRLLYSMLVVGLGLSPATVFAQDDSADLAKKLSNPVAAMISVPFQFNYDEGYGPNDGERLTLNIQPVIPISLKDEWNVISRTILPVIWQNDIAGDSGEQTGLGDITQSLFFSPKHSGPSGIIWGVGPAFLVPAGTDVARHRQMGRRPTAVVLKQMGGWTVGGWRTTSGPSPATTTAPTSIRPSCSHSFPTTHNAGPSASIRKAPTTGNGGWSVPINFTVAKLVKFDQQPVSFTAGVRYWPRVRSGLMASGSAAW